MATILIDYSEDVYPVCDKQTKSYPEHTPREMPKYELEVEIVGTQEKPHTQIEPQTYFLITSYLEDTGKS